MSIYDRSDSPFAVAFNSNPRMWHSPKIRHGIEYFLKERLLHGAAPDEVLAAADVIIQELARTGEVQKSVAALRHRVGPESASREDRANNLARQFLKNLPKSKSIRALVDVGCGRGLLTRSLAIQLQLPAEQVTGIDVARHPELVADGRFTFRLISDGCWPLEPQSADLAVICMVLHHAVTPMSIFAEVARIVRTDGFLIVRDHDASEPHVPIIADLIELIMDAWRGAARSQLAATTNYRTSAFWIGQLEQHGFVLDTLELPSVDSPWRPFTALFHVSR